MAFSPLRSKALHHGRRSLSLPSNINLAPSHFQENLSIVKHTESTMLSSMKGRLNNLKNVYNDIDDLLSLPHIQRIISSESQEKWVDQVLEGYIRLLDSSTTARDFVSQTKHDVQHLLSSLRRKDASAAQCYTSSRKLPKKAIHKCLRDLRSFKSTKHSSSVLTSSEKDNETRTLVYMMNETESATVTMIELLLSCLSGSDYQALGWSLVGKLIMNSKKLSCRGERADVNEIERIERFLQMGVEDVQVHEEIMSCLKEMDLSIQSVEQELECLFRQLIKNRAFLLNILNH